MINTAKLLAATTGFKATFQKHQAATETQWQGIAMELPSTTFEEEYGWLKESAGIREWIGDRQILQLEAEGYKIRNRDFEKTLGVDRNIIKDDRLGLMTPRLMTMGEDAGRFPDELVFDTMNRGFDTKCFDGQFFFDTDHPVQVDELTTSTASNFGGGVASSAWFLVDNSRQLKPIILQKRQGFEFTALDDPTDVNVFMKKTFMYGIDGRFGAGYGFWQTIYASRQPLNAANFEAALTAMTTMRGDYGRRLNLKPTDIWYPPELESNARDVLKVAQHAGTNNKWLDRVQLKPCGWLN
jgi:phage major head subunit gpT-like protein